VATGNARTEYSDEEYERLLKAEEFTLLGWYFWACFATLQKTDPLRRTAQKRYRKLTQVQKDACENI
jgi:hypothetical protein